MKAPPGSREHQPSHNFVLRDENVLKCIFNDSKYLCTQYNLLKAFMMLDIKSVYHACKVYCQRCSEMLNVEY